MKKLLWRSLIVLISLIFGTIIYQLLCRPLLNECLYNISLSSKEVASILSSYAFTIAGFLAAIVTFLYTLGDRPYFKFYKNRGSFADLMFVHFDLSASSWASAGADAFAVSPVSTPSPAKIKRERDVKQLREIFQWLNLGAMDRFIYNILNMGWITNEGHFLWERLCWLMESSRFHLSDIELRGRFVNFMSEWSVCFENFLDMEQHRNGMAFYFDVRGSDREYVRQQNQRAQYIGRQADPIKRALGRPQN